MTDIGPFVTISPRDYDAVLFDLDGVLTKTASVHAAAWKRLFDAFLEQRAADTGEAFVPFDMDVDYRRYVDGKPRYDGVTSFLASRGIALPFGTPADGPEAQTVHALGNLKDRYFTEHLEQHGVEIYEEAIALVQTLRAQEIKTAVVSSSNNCAAVLETAGISAAVRRAGRREGYHPPGPKRQACARCVPGGGAAPPGRTVAYGRRGGCDRRRRGGARRPLRPRDRR